MTLTAYLDTSVIVALALPFDRLHEAAGAAWDDVAAHVKPWGWLHDLEVRQTLRNLAQRNPAPAPRAALEQVACELRRDVSRGVYQRVRLEDADLPHRAEVLAAAHGSGQVVGAFDLLHIAAAELVVADLFVTGDANQAAVAKAAGLNVRLLQAPGAPAPKPSSRG
jgi:predicted nucleic acid-binding protein